MRYLYTFVFVFFFAVNAFSQSNIYQFSDNQDQFIPSLEELFKSISDKKYAKEYLEDLTIFWEDTSITVEDKRKIINTCNLMAKKKARPIPDYVTYLSTIRDFINSNTISDESFKAWEQAIIDLYKKPRYPLRKINSLLKITNDLLNENVIFSSPSTSWKSDNNNWKLIYDKDLIGIFPNLTLTCCSKNDSIHIYDTKGTFNYTSDIWKGDKGKVTWERSGFSADSVYATFNKFEIPFSNNKFELDTVEFFNYIYFNKPLYGSLKHKVMNVKGPENAIYPQFLSFQQRFNLDNIHPDINYEGGFAQNGAKFLGAGTDNKPAKITIMRHDTVFITATSQYFALRKDQILSTNTAVKIRLDTGYIYHPGLEFKFMADKNELNLIRNGEGLSVSPYFDTFHNVSIDVELIQWDMEKDYLELKMLAGAAENHSSFESLSYFRESFYNQLQGMDAIHPLQGLKDCSKLYKGKPFTAYDYAQYMHFPESEIRQQIIKLSFYGFIGYNVNTDEIEIRQRLYDYLDFRLGVKDYDVIRFNSNTPGRIDNAIMDLKNFDFSINGVKSISISDNQNVVFFPRDEQILLKRNRNFVFDGAIVAGMLNMYGQGFKFDYDKFQIDMKNIDSLRMQVQTGDLDYFGQSQLTYVHNTIEKLSGTLQIDQPNNKSGNKTFSEFPILRSTSNSYVYYDKPEIQNGIYDREKFYFQLDTFSMDSISALTRENFNFKGTFVSNIFPNIVHNLTVRKDYSLGFITATPDKGYDIYDHHATYTSKIDLSNKGLTGDGTLKYLTSTSKSQNFTFLPEETLGQAYSFEIEKQEEGVEYPDVTGNYTKISYRPFKDILESDSQEDPFVMYNKEAKLDGKIFVSTNGATGKGTFNMAKANIKSPDMTFGDHTMLADSSDFNLLSGDMGDVSFNTTNLISNIDFSTRQGKFRSKSGGNVVNFTHNKFISYISEFSWDMDKNDIYMGNKGSKGNRFVSTHRKQDSLDFLVPIARFEVENNIIYAQEVKNIKVADANLILSSGDVTIRENAEIDPLDSTLIVLEDSVVTHKIYDSHVNVKGKNEYLGYGDFDYVNGDGKTEKIHFNDIHVNDDKKTTAEGKILENDLFTFNKHFTFKGKTQLLSGLKDLTFDGGVQMLHECNGGPQTYTYFNSSIDPNNVLIPIGEEPVNYDRKNIYRDFFITKDSSHVYSTFLQDREDYSDEPIITANGYLHFNETNKAFEIANLEKINNPDTTGVLFSYSNTTCSVLAEGNLNFGVDLGEIAYKNSGTIIDDPKKDNIMATSAMGLDFFFNEAAVNIMVTTILSSTATESKISNSSLQKRFAEWIGIQEAKKLIKLKDTQKELPEMIPSMNQMFTFGNIDWQFDGVEHKYIANCKADLTFIKKYVINKKVDIKAEITKKRSGNSIEFLLQFDKDTWFYFTYKSNLMQTLSSDEAYNSTVQTLDSDERKQKGKPFSFILSPTSKLNRFLKKFDLDPIKTSGGAAGQEINNQEEDSDNGAETQDKQ